MNLFYSLVAAIWIAAASLCWDASADQNPTPVNVGLYNYSIFTVSYSYGASTFTILPRNASRAGLIISNNGAVAILIKPAGAGQPTSATDGIQVAAGALWMPMPPPVDALYIESAGANVKVVAVENIK